MKSTTIFLIQLLLWLSVILTGMPTVSAAMMPNQQIQAVQSLEDTLFAIHYDQEPLGDRVSRIEETVYGQAQTGSSIEARITKLQGSLSPKALGALSPINKGSNPQNNANAPKGNGQQANDQSASNNNQAAAQQARYSPMASNGNRATNAGQPIASANGTGAKPLNNLTKMQGGGNAGIKTNGAPTAMVPEAGETDYPTVTQMEQKEFGKTFPKEDITQRLNRLENQVFKMPQTGSLSDRTDNLRLVVLGDTGQANQAANNDGASNSGYTGPSNYQPDPQGNNVGYNGYPQPPSYGANYGANYGGGYTTPNYGNTGSASYGSPVQSSYNAPGNYGYGAPNTVASAAQGTGTPMPGYGNSVNTYQPSAIPGSVAGNMNDAPTPDMIAAMSEVEKEVLGTTHPADPINTRLDRVETKVFKTTSPEMNPQDRIQRVIAVASAGGAPPTGKAKAKATLQVLLPIILTLLPLILL